VCACVFGRAGGGRLRLDGSSHQWAVVSHRRRAAAVTAAVNCRLTNRLVNHRLHTGAYRSPLARLRSLFNVCCTLKRTHTFTGVFMCYYFYKYYNTAYTRVTYILLWFYFCISIFWARDRFNIFFFLLSRARRPRQSYIYLCKKIRDSHGPYTSTTTATLISGTVQSSGRSGTSLLQQWPVGLAAAVATGGDIIGKTRTTTTTNTAMTVHELTAASAAGTMPMHHLGRSRFMITDILSDNGRNNGSGSPVSPASSTDGPRDLSLHGRASSGSNGGSGGQGAGPAGVGGGPADSDLSDDHESGTDSGLPGDNSSVCSNGKSSYYFTYFIILNGRYALIAIILDWVWFVPIYLHKLRSVPSYQT